MLPNIYLDDKLSWKNIWYVPNYLDLKLKKIIIVGDSAGANLGMSLVNMAIRLQIRVPDSLFLIYPALSL